MVYLFEWDDAKAASNLRKHGIAFEVAATVFYDPNIVTVADLEHSETEERWYSLGWAGSGSILPVVHLWTEVELTTVKNSADFGKASNAGRDPKLCYK